MIVKMCERVRGGLEGVGCAPCEGKNRGSTVHAHARGRDTRMETCIHTYVHARGDTEEHARAHIHAHIHTHTHVYVRVECARRLKRDEVMTLARLARTLIETS